MSVFKDVATMLNAGFTASEIKDMIKLDLDAKKEAKEAKEDDTKVFETPAPKQKEKEEKEVDYKALYEQTKKDLDELQSDNTKKEVQPSTVDRDELFKNIKASIC